jgi:hypothetical protein
VHDGIELELRGVPAAVVCTVPFENMGRSTARVRGLPDYPFILVDHPLGRLDGTGLEERVQAAIDAVESLLLEGRVASSQ